ncbi:hypothetical protein BC833DRAFT_609203 [Globomyces pollinis-pini]|nr:hypothetical protein BC833DRAFT_609203 [Globomyces pollinis-pini]
MGKHVLIEKPFTVTEKEANELIELSESKKTLLTVFHNRRLDGDFKTIQQLIEKNTLGRITMIESRFDRFRIDAKSNEAWRETDQPGSGILYDLGSHLLDQIVCLFGKPETISCRLLHQRLHTQISNPPDDYFLISLTFKNNPMIVHLSSSMITKIKAPRFSIHGINGSFIKYGLDPQEDLLKKFGVEAVGMVGKEKKHDWGTLQVGEEPELLETLEGDYSLFFDNLADCISKNEPESLLVKPRQAAFVIKLLELAQKSAVEGRVLNIEQ